VVKDATAGYSDEMMQKHALILDATLDINIPSYASAIVTADQVVALLGSAEALRSKDTRDWSIARGLKGIHS
jgi:hypothetical protein